VLGSDLVAVLSLEAHRIEGQPLVHGSQLDSSWDTSSPRRYRLCACVARDVYYRVLKLEIRSSLLNLLPHTILVLAMLFGHTPRTDSTCRAFILDYVRGLVN
jgi:hypothetical protein